MGAVDNVNLYLITDDERNGGRPVEEIVEKAAAAGVRLVQYRPYMIADDDYITNAIRLRRITRKYNCMLLLNGRPDIAVQVGAEGVHIGKATMALPAARRRLFDGGIIGYSAHDPAEALKAEKDGADFITYSPVYKTASSSAPRTPVGVDEVKKVADQLSIPVFPLGGIGPAQAAELNAAGLTRAAVVSAITESDDVADAVTKLIEALK